MDVKVKLKMIEDQLCQRVRSSPILGWLGVVMVLASAGIHILHCQTTWPIPLIIIGAAFTTKYFVRRDMTRDVTQVFAAMSSLLETDDEGAGEADAEREDQVSDDQS